MQMKFLYGGIAFLALLLLVAGCTQTTPSRQPRFRPRKWQPRPTAAETATAAPTTVTLATPGPTQTLQTNWAVDVQVASNGNNRP